MIDMYRQHIETPMSIPEDLQVGMDFNAGNKFGRIYRIVPKNTGRYKPVFPDLRNAKPIDLVALLSHPNQWWRLQAQRLLLERQDQSVIGPVNSLFIQSEDPRFRLHALYVLEGMNALDCEIVNRAMKDLSPGVRENGVILSERFPGCLSQLEAMADDSSIRVVFQAALSLGEFKDKTVVPALAKIVEHYGYSSWFRTAVLSSEPGSSVELLKFLVKERSFFDDVAPWKLTFLENLSTVIGGRNKKEQNVALLETISGASVSKSTVWQSACVKGLLQGLQKAEGTDSLVKEKLKNIETESGSDIKKALQDLKQL
jgi:hypothetical protein